MQFNKDYFLLTEPIHLNYKLLRLYEANGVAKLPLT